MTESGFWLMQFKDIVTLLILVATIFAIVWGPIKAVQIMRANDDAKEKRRRQFDVFYNLMKTRRFNLSPEHVMALNLVQVDFHQNRKIDQSYRAYMALLARDPPPPGDVNSRLFFDQQDDALYDLLHDIAITLGYNYDKRDLQKLAYGPRGWNADDSEGRALRHLMIEILSGRRPLAVADWERTVASNGRFPPPPQ